jgi:hypothetical protein
LTLWTTCYKGKIGKKTLVQKCGCNSLVFVHYTNEFIQNPMKSLSIQGHLLL